MSAVDTALYVDTAGSTVADANAKAASDAAADSAAAHAATNAAAELLPAVYDMPVEHLVPSSPVSSSRPFSAGGTRRSVRRVGRLFAVHCDGTWHGCRRAFAVGRAAHVASGEWRGEGSGDRGGGNHGGDGGGDDGRNGASGAGGAGGSVVAATSLPCGPGSTLALALTAADFAALPCDEGISDCTPSTGDVHRDATSGAVAMAPAATSATEAAAAVGGGNGLGSSGASVLVSLLQCVDPARLDGAGMARNAGGRDSCCDSGGDGGLAVDFAGDREGGRGGCALDVASLRWGDGNVGCQAVDGSGEIDGVEPSSEHGAQERGWAPGGALGFQSGLSALRWVHTTRRPPPC